MGGTSIEYSAINPEQSPYERLRKDPVKYLENLRTEGTKIIAEDERKKQIALGMQTQKSQSYGLQRSRRNGITASKAMALIDQPQQPQSASKTLLGY